MNKKQLIKKLNQTTEEHLSNCEQRLRITQLRNQFNNMHCRADYLDISRIINFINGCDSVLITLKEKSERLTHEIALLQEELDNKK